MLAWEWFTSLNQEYRFAALAVVLGAVIVVTWIICNAWRRARESDNRTLMVRDMLQRGLSSEDISRLLIVAQITSNDPEAWDENEDPEAYIVKYLSDHWYEAKDTEQILQAAQDGGEIDDTTIRMIKTLADNDAGAPEIVNVLRSQRKPTTADVPR